MNIVKGVADLIRRSSSGQAEQLGSGSQDEIFRPPHPQVRFRYNYQVASGLNLYFWLNYACPVMIWIDNRRVVGGVEDCL